ncbi:MAG TPA: type II toxin-antitoxin system VapC family toxin [Candidatus Saccharimonadales bacterium]|nr:type II toxin-antitoxin system VapC family toxin [Candidatus Saccharimonadales bacterium]
MRLLLDTATFIWAVGSPERVSRKAMRSLQHSEAKLEMSAISLSEIAIKQVLGKLDLRLEDAMAGIADLKLRVLPYTADHAYHLFGLPHHHSDPFDRQIIAQALAEDIPVVTSDEKFKLYKGIEVIW